MADAKSAQDAAQQLQSQLMPSPLVTDAPNQDPAAAMNALMAGLKDIHTPPPIEWWPLAPGWWLLAGLSLILLISAITWLYLRYRRGAYRRAGLRLIKRVKPDQLAAQSLARQLNEILKRTALAAPFYKDKGVAAAHGAVWKSFLCDSSPNYPYKEDLCAQLVKALYQRNAKLDAEALVSFCAFWIQHHQPLAIEAAPLEPMTQEVPYVAA